MSRFDAPVQGEEVTRDKHSVSTLHKERRNRSPGLSMATFETFPNPSTSVFFVSLTSVDWTHF